MNRTLVMLAGIQQQDFPIHETLHMDGLNTFLQVSSIIPADDQKRYHGRSRLCHGRRLHNAKVECLQFRQKG